MKIKYNIFALIYLLIIILVSPFVALGIAVFVFFSSLKHFIIGSSESLFKKQEEDNPPAQLEDMWERHINRINSKKDLK